MTRVLFFKLLRDLRLPLLIVALLLFAFECLWAKVTQRITLELLPTLVSSMSFNDFTHLAEIFFRGPGQIVEALIGGQSIDVMKPRDVLSIGYVHPLAQTILCVWAIGRAAGAITGEIDRGTMELLLAQPLTRTQIVLAHLAVDLVAIPILCVAMWGGTLLGVAWFGELVSGGTGTAVGMQVDPRIYLPALPNTAALVFALSGTTLWLSARGRFRARVLGVAVLLTLLQFLVNLIGQLWPAVAPLRPFTLFFYYQPQQIILQNRWHVDVAPLWQLSKPLELNILIVLITVGVLGYAMALWTFSRRDVPAPL